ncbi:MAG: glycosyltransferase [Muribaculum sp.]|nr:glycosyltransferase [Muribaculum sp.]
MNISKKICYVGNHPSHYRGPIFKLMDDTFNIEWHFLKQDTNIKALNIATLKNAQLERSFFLKDGSWYFQHNVLKLFLRKDIDIFLFVGEPYSVSTWILVRLIKWFAPTKRIFFWSHGWYGKESKLKKVIKKCFFKPADGIFLYGKYAKELMIKESFSPNRLHVIHNSLDHKIQLSIRNNLVPEAIYHNHFHNICHNLIFIGRLTKVKNLDLLIRALSELNKNAVRYNLTLIGDGEEKDSLKKLASDLNVIDNIWFYGACYDELANAKLIYNADLCVSPGNVGLTAMHTMVYGTPVITHDTYKWQMPEFEAIMPGKTGDFFKLNSIDSLVETVEDWFKSNENNRENIRLNCFNEIDCNWTPEYQLKVLKDNLI